MKILDKELNKLDKKNKKRPGRGISAGGGKTAGRGTKGQKSRAGHNIPRQFEGGQSNFSLRLPKVRGFRGQNKNIVEISLDTLNATFKSGDIISEESLMKAGLIKMGQSAKILNNGELKISLQIADVKVSKSALKKFEESNKKNDPTEPKKSKASETKSLSKKPTE